MIAEVGVVLIEAGVMLIEVGVVFFSAISPLHAQEACMHTPTYIRKCLALTMFPFSVPHLSLSVGWARTGG